MKSSFSKKSPTEKVLPLDISSVKVFGVEKWQKECYKWPVSDHEFLSIYNEIDKLYANVTIRASREVSDLLLVLYKLTIEYMEFIHALLIIDRTSRSGFEVIYNENSPTAGYFDALLNNKRTFYGVFHNYRSKLWAQRPKFKERILWRAKSSARSFKYHFFDSDISLDSVIEPHYIAIREPNPDLVQYAKNNSKKSQNYQSILLFLFQYLEALVLLSWPFALQNIS